MKKFLSISLILLGAAYANAQPASKRGNWVVESNIKTPRTQIIKFYDENQDLVHQQAVNSRKLKIEKARVRRMLDEALVRALNEQPDSSQNFLASKPKK